LTCGPQITNGSVTEAQRQSAAALSALIYLQLSFWHNTKSSISGRIPITENSRVQPCLHLLEAEGELFQFTDVALGGIGVIRTVQLL